MVDIDFFESAYDNYGHATVDQADKALYAAKKTAAIGLLLGAKILARSRRWMMVRKPSKRFRNLAVDGPDGGALSECAANSSAKVQRGC